MRERLHHGGPHLGRMDPSDELQEIRENCQRIFQELGELRKTVAVTQTAQVIHNVQNIHNIHVPLPELVPFSQVDVDEIAQRLVQRYRNNPSHLVCRIQNNPSELVADLVELSHFRKDMPAYWNVRQTRPSSKYVEVFENDWQARLRKEIHSNILARCVDVLDETQRQLSQTPRTDLSEVLNENPELQRATLEKLEEALINGTRKVIQWIHTAPSLPPE